MQDAFKSVPQAEETKAAHPFIERPDISLYTPGDEEAILDCMRICFKFEPDIERWRHLYLDNPGGRSVIILARARGGKVISHVTFLPRKIQVFGRQGLVGHSIDSMTLPEWRSKGIKSALSAELRKIAKAQGLMAVFSFANKEHLPILLKYEGRRAVEPFPLLIRPLRPLDAGFALAKKWLRFSRGTHHPAQEALDPPDCGVAGPIPDQSGTSSTVLRMPSGWFKPAFDERHSHLFGEAEAIPPIAMVRNAAHLTWRYTEAPGSPYVQRDIVAGQTLRATVVIRTATLFGFRLVFVMEWFWRTEARQEGLGLIQDVIQFARSENAHGVAVLAMPGTLQRRLLQLRGFISVPEFLFPKSIRLNVRPEIQGGDTSRWFKSSNWYLTWGDGFLL
jgi:hypothetical protein